MIPRRPTQRAYHGLVGLPPESEEAAVAPAHSPFDAKEPIVSGSSL
jgi:hypothetical protein